MGGWSGCWFFWGTAVVDDDVFAGGRCGFWDCYGVGHLFGGFIVFFGREEIEWWELEKGIVLYS